MKKKIDNQITIKETDKGEATIITNKKDYKDLVQTILNDEVNYTKLNPKKNTTKIQKKKKVFYLFFFFSNI